MKNRPFFVLAILVISTVFIFACAPEKTNELPTQAQTPVKTEVSLASESKPEPAKAAPQKAITPEAKDQAKRFMIADFDTGEKPNNIDGDFGAWNKDPNDSTQDCRDSFTADERYGREGYALALKYDVDSPNPAYNGFWMKLSNIDASAYNKLAFYLKGDPNEGYPQKIKIELKNAKGEVGKTYITQISGTWAPVEVPFANFQGIKDFSDMTEFTIVFEDIVSKPKTGKIYIDNIEFVKD